MVVSVAPQCNISVPGNIQISEYKGQTKLTESVGSIPTNVPRNGAILVDHSGIPSSITW
jgi:hypothetical protein